MKWIKTYKVFESDMDDMEETVSHILFDLEDLGFLISMERIWLQKEGKINKDVYLEVYIRRPFGSRDRVIEGAPEPPSGKYPGPVFLWMEVKNVIIRIAKWYYEFTGLDRTPGINSKIYSDLRKIGIDYKSNSPLRFFNGGTEFGYGWHNEEDFTLGDFTSFTSLKLWIRL